MLIEKGEVVHVLLRRILESDLRRHFLGIVKESTPIGIRVEGFAYIFDGTQNIYIKKPEKRVKVFSFSDNLTIINILPSYVIFEDLEYKLENNKFIIKDNLGFSLEINEFSANR